MCREASAAARSQTLGGAPKKSPSDERLAPSDSRLATRPQPLAQRVGALTEKRHIPQLDLFVAAHDVGKLEELEHNVPVRLGEARQPLLHELLVLADQPALDAAHLGVPEGIDPAAAQASHRPQQPEGGDEPRPEAKLPLQAEGAE